MTALTRSPDGVDFTTHNYRHAEEILNSRYTLRQELVNVLNVLQPADVKAGPEGLNRRLAQAFKGTPGWLGEHPVATPFAAAGVKSIAPHGQFFDFFKDRVVVEVEFSRYEFVYRDYLRFLSAYNADQIDVGVLITHHEDGLKRVRGKSVAPHLGRVRADLEWLRPSLTVPLWIIALR